MKRADVLITKPGGLTCSEALAVNLPMVLLNPLPGQEEENANYLHCQGSALWVQEENDITLKVAAILNEKSNVLKEMQDKCREVSPHDAGRKIAEKINDLVGNRGKRHIDLESWQKAGVQ
jgi:processive 1,2-diacylglycerol beta-glucosyltransferase